MAALHDVTILDSEQPLGLSGARNTGLHHASSEIVAFIIDDAVAVQGWLCDMKAIYNNDPSVIAVGGSVVRCGWCRAELCSQTNPDGSSDAATKVSGRSGRRYGISWVATVCPTDDRSCPPVLGSRRAVETSPPQL